MDPIGKTLQVNRRPFTVIGVAKQQGSIFGQSRDNFVVVPVGTLFKMYGARRGIGFYGLAVDRAHFVQAQDEVRMLLRAFRGLEPKDEDNFSIFSSDSIISLWNQLTSVIAATAVTVVSVFMVVGGVVIMNIMLAVVTERTHEIGIRKAVGARHGDILNQFLVESSLLAATGGMMGVLLAWVAAVMVRNLHARAHGAALLGRGRGRGSLDRGRALFWDLPRPARGPAGSHRGAEGREMTGSEDLSAVRMALATIREHKMRSLLTVLGVIIGTGTVIAVGSIITGVDGAVVNAMRSMGPETGFVYKFNIGFRAGRISREEIARKPLLWEDAHGHPGSLPVDRGRVPVSVPSQLPPRGMRDRVRYKANDVYNLDFAGTDESYMTGGNEKMKLGRFFTDGESQHRQPVVIIGEDLQKALFASEDPLNKWIDVDGHQFEVLGVLARPSASFPGQEDRRVLLPYFTMRKMFPTARENMIIFVAKQGKLAVAIDEVAVVLRQQRRVPLNKPDNFWISTGQQMVDEFRDITSMVALVLVVLSSIGLLVGGIGVMNIMLVSVTERTREIGIRKAVGAKRSDIIAQFLTEAVVLTVLGGLLGMAFGWLISLLSRIFFPSLPTAVPLWTVAMGFAVSVGVGLFFGVWPATKAASLDPVDALRYE